MPTETQIPNSHTPKPAAHHRHNKFWLAMVAIVLLAIGACMGIYFWQQNKADDLKANIKGANSQIDALKRDLSDSKAQYKQLTTAIENNDKSAPKPTPPTEKTVSTNCTPSSSDKAQVQKVATAGLHSSANNTGTDNPSFRAVETTVIKGCFAIQTHCGPVGVESDCNVDLLRKVGGTWISIGGEMQLDDTNVKQYNSDYGWPLDFTQ